MRPLMLHGHERAITQIRYNLEGDLLFSVAKDSKPTVWYSSNGERLGTFNGHNGAIWCIDVNRDTSRVLTGSADNSTRLWDCETGTTLSEFETGSAVRSCMFSYSSNLFVYTTDATMGSVCEIYLYDVRDLEAPVRVIPIEGSRISAAVWGPFDEFLITGHENGAICRYDVTRSGHCLQSVKEHKALISDLQPSSDQIMIVTASKDNTAKLMDSENLEVLKTYRTERPVNSAAISPTKDHVVLGGGQEAREVTTTTTKAGKFDARFYHLIYEEEIGRVKGHFGPINSLKFHPDGKSYSSGGEDGYVRVHTFDSSYFEFEF
ncbi:Eukaryotic translation initiation factor 3 subunit I [Geodia barretti]|uniref:Eukaryotic translation initiation factor 3 subunit I n=1 Tax=Geodia barretti TaxID=519541 RepID=A0AA35T080_GEOBA|nr:Eukaryotic translation initiation factor 3 subunit I [Geodia barretti]